MVAEFERYKLARFRRLTGILQLLASMGLIVGYWIPWLAGISAAGLTLQMACALAVRICIGDNWLHCLPSAFYMLICGYLAIVLL